MAKKNDGSDEAAAWLIGAVLIVGAVLAIAAACLTLGVLWGACCSLGNLCQGIAAHIGSRSEATEDHARVRYFHWKGDWIRNFQAICKDAWRRNTEMIPEPIEGGNGFGTTFNIAKAVALVLSTGIFLPVFFPAGAAVFKMFRVARIMRLFRINAYYDSLNAITDVITSKKQQLLSSVFVIFVLMLASSMCMYSLENKAQPEVFSNAFSGIWWSASTLLTVGYGSEYS